MKVEILPQNIMNFEDTIDKYCSLLSNYNMSEDNIRLFRQELLLGLYRVLVSTIIKTGTYGGYENE